MNQFSAALSKEALQTTPSVERIQRKTTETWESSTSSYSTANDSTFAIIIWMNMNNWIVASGQLDDVNRIYDSSVREQINDLVGSSPAQDLSSQDYGSSRAGSDPGSGGSDSNYGNNDTGTAPTDTGSSYNSDYSSPSVDTTSF